MRTPDAREAASSPSRRRLPGHGHRRRRLPGGARRGRLPAPLRQRRAARRERGCSGRFCHADAELTRRVEEHLRAEEALRPDALFAEIVHLPQGRIGNILSRPVLREYEIPFLGRSGAPAERADPGHRPARSPSPGSGSCCARARLGREVIPRLTSAHNFCRGSLGVYRFLCMLQARGCSAAWAGAGGRSTAPPSCPASPAAGWCSPAPPGG